MKPSALIAGCLLAATVSGPAIAQQLIFTAELLGANERPDPNNSTGTGMATVTIDPDQGTMHVHETFSGLLAPTTVSHIHCCAGPDGTAAPATTVPSFPGFPVEVTAGTYDQTFNMLETSSYNPAFISANGGTAASAFNAFVDGLNNGTAYANIHTEMFQAGEIRGTLVPEPETYAMLLAGLAMVSMMSRRRLLSREDSGVRIG
ncbi:PEP-CTERM protein-sorting domain-containing protein [Nitrosospira multiformis]|uniref:PEP-CTERM protein-sorting domain-containing protein n=1 Tax=Nitrosospira multiformis TaxID=1231 RepID=A0A1H8BG75_9PROT|nr:CHRD domain-containing protein [Nitrosospira multiformis]SEM81950.1 PEP-CTERM protein-sorting domain-containing protein [Nitrosospira multiformis]